MEGDITGGERIVGGRGGGGGGFMSMGGKVRYSVDKVMSKTERKSRTGIKKPQGRAMYSANSKINSPPPRNLNIHPKYILPP